MAMTLPLSPASDSNTPASPQATSPITTTTSNNTNSETSAPAPAPAAATSGQMKRKPSRRANTAERRATHNAVERQRRETLNGRFLDLAQLLPNLSQIRRPSKSSIVNSSIAHIHASRRHRALAARELRLLKHETDALRRELNEWRDRAGIPRVEEPIRGEGFGMVISGELEVITAVGVEEEDEDGEDGMPTMQQHQQQQQQQYQGAYMDDIEEDVIMPVYQQQQPPQMMHHPMMHHHDMDDPRVAALLLKNAASSNPFAHNLPPPPPHSSAYSAPRPGTAGSYDSQTSSSYGYQPGFGYDTRQQQPPQAHLFTPPATSHGLPTSTGSNSSNAGSPVGGLSANPPLNLNTAASPSSGSAHGSPVSVSSAGGMLAPPNTAVSEKPPHGGLARRERSGSVMSGSGTGSPAYELHPHGGAGMEYGMGVPRRGGGGGGVSDYLGMFGMGMQQMHPHGGHGQHHGQHGHHQQHQQQQQQGLVGGSAMGGAMMMMMM